MAIGRVKTWIAGEVLTAADLNAEFNNILNNALSLISPITGTLDLNGNELVLDADADTSITADTDDRVDIRASGADLFRFDGTATTPVNGFDFVASATGTAVHLIAQGTDTNIDAQIRSKGSGDVILADDGGNQILIGADVASAVNEVTVTNAATGNAPNLSATGDDTNIDLALTPKGTGQVNLGGPMDTNDQAVNFSEGSAVASASSTDIWATDGNTVHVTGTTQIDDFGTAPRVGAERWVIFDGALTLAHSANLNLQGSANITTAAGDFAKVYADTTTQMDVLFFKADGTSVIGGTTVETEQATTSGTSADFTSISSSAKRITMSLDGVSLSGTDLLAVRLGDSGGFETTGYVSSVSAGTTFANNTTRFQINVGSAASNVWYGVVELVLEDSTNNTWSMSANLADGANPCNVSAGRKALSATLDRVQLLATGTDTFDAGAVNIQVYT